MRVVRALFALLLFTVVPMAGAVPDDVGDHEVGLTVFTLDGEQQTIWQDAQTLGWYPEADIVDASVSETQNEVIFQVQWSGGQSTLPEPQDFFRLWHRFDFTLRGQEMVGAFMQYRDEDFQDFGFFILGMRDDESFFGMQPTSGWPSEMVDQQTLRVVFPKQYFRDADYIPLRQGDTLKDLQLRTYNDDFGFPAVPLPACAQVWTNPTPFAFVQTCDWQVRDELPGIGDLAIEQQAEGVGHILMRSDRPWRLSNGLATTYLFEVDVHNFDDEPDEVLLAANDVPTGWEVLHPASVTFTEAGVETVPVAVTVPFVHEHGSTAFMSLEAASKKDPETAMGTPLGVIFADPPQPGGHHPDIFFHAHSNGFFSPWMNTRGELSEEEGTTADGRYRGSPIDQVGAPVQWEWNIRLDPSLQMGLDFDLSRDVVLEAAIEMGNPITATPRASLELWGQERMVLAEMVGEETDFAAAETQNLELRGRPSPEADRIEYGAGNLYLRIVVEGTPTPDQYARILVQPTGFMRTDESRMSLPLIDFHEEVDLSGFDLNAFTIHADRTFGEVNPGKTAAFLFNVTNHLSKQQTLAWEVSGANHAWATIEPAQTVLPGSGVGQVVLQVTPPEGTFEGESAELLLLGTSTDSDARQVFLRVTAYVVTDEDIPDEAMEAQEAVAQIEDQNEDLDKGSPGFEVAALLALLGALAVLLRRRS